jgi:hypothetical protein
MRLCPTHGRSSVRPRLRVHGLVVRLSQHLGWADSGSGEPTADSDTYADASADAGSDPDAGPQPGTDTGPEPGTDTGPQPGTERHADTQRHR